MASQNLPASGKPPAEPPGDACPRGINLRGDYLRDVNPRDVNPRDLDPRDFDSRDGYLRDRSRLRWILFCAAFASFIVNVNTYIVNISLPEISRYFSVSTGQVTFVVQAFQLSVTGLLLIVGRVGDYFGLRRMFVIGFLFFAAASLLCGLSPYFYMLVGMRFVQGVAASILYALTPALIAAYYPVEDRGPAFGIMAIFTALGMTLGASIGGIINSWFSWHGIFLVNVPIALAGALICWRAIPGSSAPAGTAPVSGSAPFDYKGALLSMTALMAFVAALGNSRELGWESPFVAGGLAFSIAATIWFVLHERSSAHPLMDLELLSRRELSYGNLASIFAYMFMSGTNFLIPFYLTGVLGYSSATAGLIFMIYPLLYMLIGPAAGFLSKRVASRSICNVSMTIGSAAALMFALTLDLHREWPVVLFLVMQAFTFGGFTTSNNNVVMSIAPPGQEGQVSSLYRMLMRIGLIVGLALFELVFSTGLGQYADSYSKNLASIPADVLDRGFEYAYYAGFVCCLAALVSSNKARRA